MLKIIPMSKTQEQERVCLLCGIEYDKSQFSYGAYEDEAVVGASQFFVKDGIGYISDLRCRKEGDDLIPLAMLLGRSVLNFMDLHGVKEAYFEKSGAFYDDAARAIGFRLKDGKYYAYLDGMFTSHNH